MIRPDDIDAVLAEVAELDAKASAGEWLVIPPGHGHPSEYQCVQFGEDDRYASLEMLPADARFIARARTLLPLLAAEVRRLRQALTTARDDLKRLVDGVDTSDFYHSTCVNEQVVDDVRRDLDAALTDGGSEAK